jgi:5-methylcytosine-specific restriction endonuclease McrA
VAVSEYLSEHFWPAIQRNPANYWYAAFHDAAYFNPRRLRRLGAELRAARWEFNMKALVLGQFPLAASCFWCGRSAPKAQLEHHHIVSLQHWGPNRRYNLVSLCRLCHKRIHPWLK